MCRPRPRRCRVASRPRAACQTPRCAAGSRPRRRRRARHSAGACTVEGGLAGSGDLAGGWLERPRQRLGARRPPNPLEVCSGHPGPPGAFRGGAGRRAPSAERRAPSAERGHCAGGLVWGVPRWRRVDHCGLDVTFPAAEAARHAVRRVGRVGHRLRKAHLGTLGCTPGRSGGRLGTSRCMLVAGCERLTLRRVPPR